MLRGTAGVVSIAGASGAAAAQEGGNGSGGEGGGPTKTVEVGPGGEFVFRPGTSEPLNITPGTTVKFVWKSDNHNIVPEEQPDSASWEGTPGPPSKTYDSGYTYTHTFETLGQYRYYCEPHLSVGMTGRIQVVESLAEAQGPVSILPDSAKTLSVAATGAMTSVLGLAYIFLKYSGDNSVSE